MKLLVALILIVALIALGVLVVKKLNQKQAKADAEITPEQKTAQSLINIADIKGHVIITTTGTHVVLINGKVEVSNTKGGSYTRLYPGEDAHLQSDGNFILAEVDLDSYVYWKDGYFYFDNVTLKDIMQNLGRWYNVNIEFRNKEAMEYKMHFISDRTKDLEHTISLLNRMKKVTVTLQGNTLTVD